MSRKIYLTTLFSIGILLVACNNDQPSDEAIAHAHQILKEVPLIDGHTDLRQRTPHDTDIERLRQGRIGAQFWSVFIPGEIKEQGFAKAQLEQIDIALRLIEKYPEAFELALTADGIKSAFARGKIGSLLGMRGRACH